MLNIEVISSKTYVFPMKIASSYRQKEGVSYLIDERFFIDLFVLLRMVFLFC